MKIRTAYIIERLARTLSFAIYAPFMLLLYVPTEAMKMICEFLFDGFDKLMFRIGNMLYRHSDANNGGVAQDTMTAMKAYKLKNLTSKR